MPTATMKRAAQRQVAQMDRAFLGRGEAAKGIRVVQAKGSTVTDASGKRYLDLTMGWSVGNFGWANPEIEARVRNFRGPSYVSPEFQYAPWADLAALLADLAPGRLRRAFRATGGTEAIEIAIQAAMRYTGRERILTIEGCYHGNSIAARSAAGQGFRNVPSKQIAPPLDALAAARVESALRGGEYAALLLEPIVLHLGVAVPTDEFMARVQRACRETGTLLIFDEIACGMGRTGKLFAAEHFDAEPDILCLAKALTGGHAPLGATLMTNEVAQGVAEDLSFHSTYGWHPRSVEAALATIRFWQDHERALIRNIEARGAQFRDRLGEIFGDDAKVCAKGLAIGVELDDVDDADRLVERCRKKGVLLASDEEIVLMFPALTIDARTASRGLAIVERAW